MLSLQSCGAQTLSTVSGVALMVARQVLSPTTLGQLDSRERDHIEAARWTVREVAKGSAILDEGESCIMVSILLSGWAFRYQALPDGKRQILDFVLPGTLIGFAAGDASWYGVESLTTCRIASMPAARFRQLLASCPSLTIRIAERIAESERRAHVHMTSIGRRNARERVAGFIVELAALTGMGHFGAGSRMTDIPVTQAMIGDALGLSNEHVCRTLGKLENDGVIALGRNEIQVLNPRALIREAGIDPCDVLMDPDSDLALAS